MNYEISDIEKEAMLHRAFVDGHADFIIISDRREWRQIESANYGCEKGWLTGKFNAHDEQSTYFIYRLTEEGRKHFGV